MPFIFMYLFVHLVCLNLIQELAEYEKVADHVTITQKGKLQAMFIVKQS